MLSRWSKRIRPGGLLDVKQRSINAADFVSGIPSQLADGIESYVTEPVKSGYQHLLDLPENMFDLVTSERRVPVFLVPIGAGPTDMEILFDFTEQVSALKSGILTRPVLQIWAGRSDIDEEWFINTFQQEFLTQFEQARRAVEDHLNRESDRIADDRSEAISGFSRQSIKTIRNTLMILIGAPFFMDWIFLNWALDSSEQSIKHLRETISLTKELRSTRRESRKQIKKLDQRFSERQDGLKQAIQRLEIEFHPQLALIDSLFIQKDSSDPPKPDHPGDLPEIRDHLDLAELRKLLPRNVQTRFDSLGL